MLSVSDRLVLTFFVMLVAGPLLFHYLGPAKNDPTFIMGESLNFRMDGSVLPMRANNDEDMMAAMAQAQATVGQFIAALDSPKAGQTEFRIKVPVLHPKSTDSAVDGEYVWLVDLVFSEDEFKGVIANETKIPSASLGDRYTIAKDEISDWLYVDDGVLVGGFTYRLLRSRLSPQDQRVLDRAAGIQVKDETVEGE